MSKKLILLHILCCFSFYACKDSAHTKDLSGIEVDLNLNRFEQKLFKTKGVDGIVQLAKEEDFYPFYVNNIMSRRPDSSAEETALAVYQYISPPVDSLYKMTQAKFGDFDDYYERFTELAKYIKFHFPDEDISGVTTFVAIFEYASIFDEDNKHFAVGLDMYMGRDFEIYAQLNSGQFPRYRLKRFEETYILPNAARSFLNYKLVKAPANTFIEHAVKEGIVTYGSQALLPGVPDSLHLAYTTQQMEWCESNVKNIWSYLIEEDLIFSTDLNRYEKHYFNDGPFTTPLGNESSPRLGTFIGWKIVNAYMAKHPETTFADLAKMTDYKKIFADSKFKP